VETPVEMPVKPAASRLRPILAIALAACTAFLAPRAEASVLDIPNARFEPVAWTALPGWAADNHAAAFDAFLASCAHMVARKRRDRGGAPARAVDAPLRKICAEAVAHGPAHAREARVFFERRFKPVRIAKLEEAEGFLTGYYEPVVAGSRQPSPEYTVPIYRRPDDLIPGVRTAGLGFANKGGAFRRVADPKTKKETLVPYFDRGEIEDGALDGKDLEICWLKDPVDAFFMQIQGSARVQLEDGAVLRLNYAAHNGHPYTPVGGILVRNGEVPREEMSMDRIRAWMLANPDKGKELRRQNRSFVFFRIADLAAHEEAVGGQGIPLASGRSIAVDAKLHVYGTPFWIDAGLPLGGETAKDPFRRLMIAQDTGSAIVGPARADIYFGAGEAAGSVAGRIKHPGTFVMLVPKELALNDVKQPVPLPRPKPRR
jgi:membrane-bound lytic murein transglycosylase A